LGPQAQDLACAGEPTAPPTAPPTARGPAQATLPLPGLDDAPPPALTISQLNARVRDGLRGQFPEAIWVVGEIVDYDKGAGREHRFFQLVEKAPSQPRALAAVEVALFSGTAERLLDKLASGDDPLTLRDGIEIRALVRLDLYVATGRFQVVVQDIDPSFTLGKLALTREQILRELRGKNLAERNRSLGFPVPALRIGVLTSPDSDGWNDFLRQLQESTIGFAVTLAPVKVQGVELKPDLLRGLAWFAAHADRFDVLCILRGGGSRTDLAWFDDRDLAFAVAQHPLKILVGIGHQRDQSVLDAIAHSEKTPTAVAALLIGAAEGARADVAERAARLHAAVTDHLATRRSNLTSMLRAVQRAAERHLQRCTAALAATAREMQAAARTRLARQRADLRAAVARARQGSLRVLERTAARLDGQQTRHRLLDPTHVLRRGYALVRSPQGRVLPSVTRLSADQTVLVQFRDGTAEGRITRIHPDP